MEDKDIELADLKSEFFKEIADKESIKKEKEEVTLRHEELEKSKALLEKKFEEQTKEIQDLKSEICRAEDDKQAAKESGSTLVLCPWAVLLLNFWVWAPLS